MHLYDGFGRRIPTSATHSARLERWLGPDSIDRISQSMRGWHGPPIALAGVPGSVWAFPGGDFRGPIRSGEFVSGVDFALQRIKRIFRRCARRQMSGLNVGFSSLSDLISETTQNNKRILYQFSKVGPTGVVSATSSLWGLGNTPAAGSNASAAPGGDATTSSTTGAFPFTNPTGGDTQHFVVGYPISSVAGNTLLLYDRLFQVNKTMASSATEAVTGVPTRYQSQTATDPDYIGGNFLFVETGGTQLAATGHNWTVCTYNDQAGASSTLPSLTGNSANIVRRLDHPTGQWFAPLEAGDVGVKALTQMQCSASVATGVINFVIGHPLAFMPCPLINMVCVADGINTSFSLTRIFDSAALALLEIMKPATTATNYCGQFETAFG